MQNDFSRSLISLRDDINFIEIYEDYFVMYGQKYNFPQIALQVP
jgi:hypothetical protein